MKGVTSIERNGTNYWYARVNGQRVYCGKDDKGRKLAEAARAKHIAKQYENREMSAGLKVKRSELKTVKDMANWYMALPTVQDKKSYKRKIHACVHLLKFFGNRRIGEVEADDIERYRHARIQQRAGHSTVNLELAVLSAMFNLAQKRKKIQAEAMPGEFAMVDDKNPRPIVPAEVFEEILKHTDEDFADFLICGYESAMRNNEICSLRAGQVHLDIQHFSGAFVDYIDLGTFDTKTGARRTVPVSPRLKEVLARRLMGLDKNDHVFTYSGNKEYTPSRVCKSLRQVCKKAGIPYGDNILDEKGERIGIVFHCLRHTRTTLWVEAGFSDEIIRRATGHNSLEAYRQYIKLDPSVVMRLVDDSRRHKDGIKSLQSVGGS